MAVLIREDGRGDELRVPDSESTCDRGEDSDRTQPLAHSRFESERVRRGSWDGVHEVDHESFETRWGDVLRIHTV